MTGNTVVTVCRGSIFRKEIRLHMVIDKAQAGSIYILICFNDQGRGRRFRMCQSQLKHYWTLSIL